MTVTTGANYRSCQAYMAALIWENTATSGNTLPITDMASGAVVSANTVSTSGMVKNGNLTYSAALQLKTYYVATVAGPGAHLAVLVVMWSSGTCICCTTPGRAMAALTENPAFRWRITGRHPHWVEPAIIDVTASSEHYAISQARGWLYHSGGGLEALQAQYTAACLGWHFREPVAK